MNLPRLSELPVWSDYDRIGLDIETRDPDLKDTGPGVRRDGYITGVSFCCGDENGPAFYLPMRHEAGGNYDDPERVEEYLRDMARHFRGDIVGANLPYDLDFLAEVGIDFKPKRHIDIQVSGPLLDQPTMARMQDKTTGKWFWGEEFHRMSLDAQAERLHIPGKNEDGLRAWAEERGLDPKADMWKAPAHIVSPYAIVDARLPMQISTLHEHEIAKQNLEQVYDVESRLLPVLLKMRRVGVAVDLKKLDLIDAKAWALENKACREVTQLTGRQMSPDDTTKTAALADILRAGGVTEFKKTDIKISEKTGKQTGGADSVTSPWLRSLNTPLADAILMAKKWNKVRTTFCQSIKDHEIKGRIHCTFNQLRQERDDGDIKGAAFGRLSSSAPNLQQQPARDPDIGPLWRSIYLPDEGGKWACLDFNGQEPRLIIHFAEMTGCIAGREAAEACRTDPNWDNHSMMASMMYDQFVQADLLSNDKAIAKAAKQLRGDAKTIFLGLCYGMGGGKLCKSLGLPTVWETPDWANGRSAEMAGDEGAMLLQRFKDRVPYVQQLQRMVKNRAMKKGYILTLLGRRCRFPIHPETGKLEWAYKGLNRLIQGSAADQTKLAMVLADEAGIRLQLQVHDELDLTIWNDSEAEQLNEIMVNAIPLNVPTICDIETGPDWGHIAVVA